MDPRVRDAWNFELENAGCSDARGRLRTHKKYVWWIYYRCDLAEGVSISCNIGLLAKTKSVVGVLLWRRFSISTAEFVLPTGYAPASTNAGPR